MRLLLILLLLATTMVAQDRVTEERSNYRAITSSVLPPSNDNIANAILINACGTSFTSTNAGATAGGCGVYGQDVDCSGANDVGFSVETDIFYKFCPLSTGNWTISITPSACSGCGFQYGIFQGTGTGMPITGTYVQSGGPSTGPPCGWTSTRTITLNVTNTTNCIFIMIDGYAGATCTFNVSLSTTTCALPIELVSFEAYRSRDTVYFDWTVASEFNVYKYEVYGTKDFKTITSVYSILSYGNSSTTVNYSGFSSTCEDGYYYLLAVDYDNSTNRSNISYVVSCEELSGRLRYYDLLGREVDINSVVPGIYFTNNKSKIIRR